jgi:putative toxin-antitoxin system antitoxin component (TIGR02293 family)
MAMRLSGEKLQRYERIMQVVRRIVPDDKAAEKWMLTPAAPLNNVAPIDLLDTEAGAREVVAFIIGIGHGNFQ